MKKIYLIRKTETNTYKIGKSKHPKKRILQLQTANETVLELVFVFDSKFADKLERMLHLKYKYNKRLGEWFELDNEQVLKFLDTCAEFENTLKILSRENHFFNKL